MNILFLRNLFILILIIIYQPSLAQPINDIELQKLLIENPSIVKNIPQEAGMGGGSMNAASLISFFIKKKNVKIK